MLINAMFQLYLDFLHTVQNDSLLLLGKMKGFSRIIRKE